MTLNFVNLIHYSKITSRELTTAYTSSNLISAITTLHLDLEAKEKALQ